MRTSDLAIFQEQPFTFDSLFKFSDQVLIQKLQNRRQEWNFVLNSVQKILLQDDGNTGINLISVNQRYELQAKVKILMWRITTLKKKK
ncbi:hypothetical protein TTHERM_000787425 (macronuclear) [Tetrahymena thermophila SB210]|uniref:Uncharacterized protein n=1 Tax=Tetrahymena thermophila (strain SB210) TaxID=312017 RepID=W7X8U3_TETTS|nr:hypothetical protein TTHERM_000787425 [Tetrahymena thermophila SB210]EWS72798.1 hypothetical protein TTHERM_000787425 [Tetrahymena thermophila SB210]|eukprot:XP_012654685.1 hypothetical protein TTHERM_000787425 [Tetrahymena thermophila SB210]